MFQSPCGDLESGDSGTCVNILHPDGVFQSPCGDLESGDQAALAKQGGLNRFQSPCGDLESGDGHCILQHPVSRSMVSVPLRGFRVWRLL